MMESGLLDSAICEYQGILGTKRVVDAESIDTNRLVRELSRRHDWTEDGARAIVSLVENYGAFMLRNALALAIVLGMEDGELGF